MMQLDRDFTLEDEDRLNPTHQASLMFQLQKLLFMSNTIITFLQISIANALKFIKNPVRCCWHIYKLIQELNKDINDLSKHHEETGESKL